jgi:hypothetical protein
MSSVLRGGPPLREEAAASAPATPPARPPGAPSPGGVVSQRGNTPTVIAGVGVLLLAMGVGVLIGRSGAPKQAAAAPQVITVASSTPATGAVTTPSAEASFTGDWPSGKSGYTVQLQTLPESGTAVSAVQSAKSAASAKGAKAVGALKSEEFSSLSSGSYVIYSGIYNKKPEAEKALSGLKSFPGAKVINVSNGAGSSTAQPPTSSPGGVGESENHPAPPTVLKSLKSGKGGKSYEEKSKNLPDVVED